MPLIINLKPGEKLILGDAVITNDNENAKLHIEGPAPKMREKDIMRESEADTACKKVYLLIELMYLSKKPSDLHEQYFSLIREIQAAAPSCASFFMKISDHLMDGHYYKALQEAKKLIGHEQKLLTNV